MLELLLRHNDGEEENEFNAEVEIDILTTADDDEIPLCKGEKE